MSKFDDLDKRLNSVESEMEKTKDFNLIKHTNETRSKIANTFVRGFFLTIGVWTLLIMIYNQLVYWRRDYSSWKDIKDVLINMSSALPILISWVSWPLGFVVGYYFKTESSKQGMC